jgi:predicted nucleic acid-binding Zn ribbon protein
MHIRTRNTMITLMLVGLLMNLALALFFSGQAG